jgi:hypothetical protein
MIALGGLFPAKETVEALLVAEEGVQKRILDLGTINPNSEILVD